MNGDVMALCNDLTYCGRLRCGNAQAEGQRLVLPPPGLGAIPPPRLPMAGPPAAQGVCRTAVAAATGSSGVKSSGSSGVNSRSSDTNSTSTSCGRGGAGVAVNAAAAQHHHRGSHHHNDPAWQGKSPPAAGNIPPHLAAAAKGLKPWLTEVLDPERRVVFLDTDALCLDGDGGMTPRGGGAGAGMAVRSFSGLEVRSAAKGEEEGGGEGRKGTLVNAVECDVVRLLAWGLDAAGFDVGGVGVISPYRSQVSGGA